MKLFPDPTIYAAGKWMEKQATINVNRVVTFVAREHLGIYEEKHLSALHKTIASHVKSLLNQKKNTAVQAFRSNWWKRTCSFF